MPSENVGKKIGFIGAGNMAEALAQGFISKKKVQAKDIWATDISQERKKVFEDFGANASDSSSEASLSFCHFSARSQRSSLWSRYSAYPDLLGTSWWLAYTGGQKHRHRLHFRQAPVCLFGDQGIQATAHRKARHRVYCCWHSTQSIAGKDSTPHFFPFMVA